MSRLTHPLPRASAPVPNQIVFRAGPAMWSAAGCRETVRALGLSSTLPSGMFARYVVERDAAGVARVCAVIQARAPGGRRYFEARGLDAESDVQVSILRWAARILRERRKESA